MNSSADNDRARIAELVIALDESLKLQSHYAKLLNMHDGGKRMTFASVKAWIARLHKVGKLPAAQKPQ